MADTHVHTTSERGDAADSSAAMLVFAIIAILAVATFAFFAFNGTFFNNAAAPAGTTPDTEVNVEGTLNTPTTPAMPVQ